MPRASANMSAKFMAQIEISKPWARSARRPAEARRPSMVSRSGSPAATSDPNASRRIARVTGHEYSSDFIIALRLAALKSDHIPEAPVRFTEIALVESACSLPSSESAAATIAVGSAREPPRTSAVWPSREIDVPTLGGTTVEIPGLERNVLSTLATVARKAGELALRPLEWMTTSGAELESPPKFRWISERACTDCEPLACQPAPDNAVSTCGAKTASATASVAQITAKSRK